MRGGLRLGPAWIAGGAAAAAAAAAGAMAWVTDEPADRLPDLVQRAPYQLVGQTVGEPPRQRFRIAFASAVENHGAGPLIVEGRHRAGQAGDAMVADQVIRRTDGSRRRRRSVGRLRYTRSTTHQHWHYLRFDRYSLVPLGRARAARRDRKTGFCLGDRYDARPGQRLAGDPGRPVHTGECGRDQPGLNAVGEGISVGYGDDYDPILEGQFLDVTGLPAGRYELLHVVNGDRRLRESDYSNNAASIVLDITWPRGPTSGPAVKVVRRCGDGRRCSRAR